MEILFWLLFALVFYTYLGYGILLFQMVKIKEVFIKPRLPEFVEDHNLPDVTLFITAYNEESVVAEKMENSQALDYPQDKLHIVWVTDGSNDATNKLLAEYQRATVYHIPDRRGKTAAMNRGMTFIETPLVIFTDANTILNREAVRNIVAHFQNPRVGCVSGEKRIAINSKDTASSSGEGFYWRYESILKDWDSRLYTTVGAAGELFAVRTELYSPAPDYVLLDDFVVSMEIVEKGYKISYCPTAYAQERGSYDMKEEEKRKTRIAAGGLQSVWMFRHFLNIFRYHILTFQFFSHRVLRWTIAPFALLLLLPINFFLCSQNHNSLLYCILFVLQLLFYGTAYIGFRLSRKQIKHKVFFIPYYFLFMNINVMKGILYLRKNKKGGIWEKSQRK